MANWANRNSTQRAERKKKFAQKYSGDSGTVSHVTIACPGDCHTYQASAMPKPSTSSTSMTKLSTVRKASERRDCTGIFADSLPASGLVCICIVSRMSLSASFGKRERDHGWLVQTPMLGKKITASDH